MIWGCLGGGKVSDIVKIDGIMLKEVYLDLLKNHVLISGKCLIGEGFVF